MLKAINRSIKVICIILLAIMAILTFVQVIFRYIIQSSLSWSEELITYMFIWLTFLAATIAVKEDRHLRITMFVDIFKNNRQISKIFKIIADLLCMGYMCVLLIKGINAAGESFRIGQVSSSMEFIPMGFLYLAIPISSLIMLVYFGSNIKK